MTDAKQRIVDAALKEFAVEGYGGARMDKIAKTAGINKAMIFYYFNSKDNLYKSVLKEVMLKIFGSMSALLAQESSAESFLEKMPQTQITFLSKNQDFIRIIALDLIRSPQNIKDFFKEFFKDRYDKGPGKLMEKVAVWYKNGEVSEKDPMQFMINIFSLNIYTFIGKPIFEAIFNMDIDESGDFYQKRIDSVVNLLKRGMLK